MFISNLFNELLPINYTLLLGECKPERTFFTKKKRLELFCLGNVKIHYFFILSLINWTPLFSRKGNGEVCICRWLKVCLCERKTK